MAIAVNYSTEQIDITDPTTSVDVQDLVDTIRAAEATEEGIVHAHILEAAGKDDLGDNISVGITAELQNDWQVKFADGMGRVTIHNGNLIGGLSGDPIAITTGVNVKQIMCADATIITPEAEWTASEKSDLIASMSRALGLSFENSYRHSITYDATDTDKVLTEQLDVYDGAANASAHDGSTGLIASYAFTYTYNADDTLESIKAVEA